MTTTQYIACCQCQQILQGHQHNGDQAARRPCVVFGLHSLTRGFGESRIRVLMASLKSQNITYQTCSIDIFVISNRLAAISKGTCWVCDRPFLWLAHGFLLAPFDTHRLSLTV